ncbi:MAG: hypothetical protein OK456_07140 [Thaumarchaeota archaeon]|nr:hypothetical protein [Nitrososphaerota archaeon]
MGRKTVLIGFWLLGYLLGFLAWTLRDPLISAIAHLGVNQDIASAILAGIAGGFLMVVSVLVWSALD